MDTAPKNQPILAFCASECNDPQCAFSAASPDESPDGRLRLCLYHGHAEGMGAVGDGPHVIAWGGAWDDSTWEYPDAGWMPDWWFRFGSDFEEAANPLGWLPIPTSAIEARSDETQSGSAEGESATSEAGDAQ
jgi:hypothetical protein